MEEITLQALLEAGCHFGHKSERWHPKAAGFIYTEKDGVHIIDLAKTKAGLEAAREFIRGTVAGGKEVILVATKRQAQGVVKEEAEKVGAPYFVERWIGGFLTNWESVKKNLDKVNTLTAEEANGVWKKFPKHEQAKLSRYLAKLKVYYGGVANVKEVPAAIFIVDIKKEIAAMREAQRMNVPVVAVVDTNSDPTGVDYVIPANDDAVGSIQFITHAIAEAYREGKEARTKEAAAVKPIDETKAAAPKVTEVKVSAPKDQETAVTPETVKPAEEKPKAKPTAAPDSAEASSGKKAMAGKRGRPRKTAEGTK